MLQVTLKGSFASFYLYPKDILYSLGKVSFCCQKCHPASELVVTSGIKIKTQTPSIYLFIPFRLWHSEGITASSVILKCVSVLRDKGP